DGAAREILHAAADELARLARILIAHAGPAPLIFTGGVLDLGPWIRNRLARHLAAESPRFAQFDAAMTAARTAWETRDEHH
ncbi:MAG TPA: N-acetylglucosamine kinase, partial [Paracoccus sp.]|nr:N-acetylglucosamine kinase [Paracoccus sp. (in: a-proteobacteria)]